jgi:hypothetical protein
MGKLMHDFELLFDIQNYDGVIHGKYVHILCSKILLMILTNGRRAAV